MAIEFLCPRCQTEFNVSDEDAGTKQRCPHCQSKVRVPVPQKLAAASRSTIEFKCPRCDEVIRARGEYAGIKQFCPRCGGKVRVPTPRIPLPGASPDRHDAPVSHAELPIPQAPVAEPLSAIAAESHEDIPWTRPRRRQRNNLLGLSIPVVCIGLIAAVGALLMRKPPPKLEGTLAGERVTDNELGPYRVDNEYLGKSKEAAKPVFERLEAEPIRASSQFLTLEFRGSAGGIVLSLRAADGAEFYRVDPKPAKLLLKYLAEHEDEFKTSVENELTRSVPEFLAAVEQRGNETNEFSGLAEFRDTVGLASLMRGFGYHVQAVIGKQAYPCVLEDRDGRLFFALPAGTEEFEIVGRERGGKSSKGAPGFPGHYAVEVSKKSATIHPEAPDPKEKIRKLLK